MGKALVTPVSFRKAGDAQILWRCLGYLRPYRSLAVTTYAATLGITALSLVTPQLMRWIVDHGIREQNTSLLAWSVLALLGVTLVRGVLTFYEGRGTETVSQSIAYDLRNAIHLKLASLSLDRKSVV